MKEFMIALAEQHKVAATQHAIEVLGEGKMDWIENSGPAFETEEDLRTFGDSFAP